MSNLALFGGDKSVQISEKDMYKWPIITNGIEDAVLGVLRDGKMSGLDVSKEFGKKFADWHGVKYALPCNNGTASLQSALFGLGVGKGDEVIAPSLTYWASCLPAYSLGANIVFADIDPNTLCLDPNDIEHRITDRTKVIIVVHYCAMPADMDAIMAIAKKHNIAVLEDASHAHGSLYKGKLCGSLGDVAGFSLMSGKSFAVGEGGIMLTNNQRVYERAILWGHYARHSELQLEDLKQIKGLPLGGYKYRMHQLSAAMGLEQIKNFPEQLKGINKAMNHFWDLLEGVPGIKTHRTAKDSGNSMGAWYNPRGLYVSEELEGLSVTRFCEAIQAEGVACYPGGNVPLHKHPIFENIDIYNDGKPTSVANLASTQSLKELRLPVTETINSKIFGIPWFKHYRPEIIEENANAFKKVVENYKELLDGDKKDVSMGNWGLTARK